MGIFGAIKNRIFGRREENLGDIRSHVLSEPPEPRSFPENVPERGQEFQETPDFPETAGFEKSPDFEERRPIALEESLDERGPMSLEYEGKKDYEIIDRLNLIEAQLLAIRSQTETINERLKNLETRFPRRY